MCAHTAPLRCVPFSIWLPSHKVPGIKCLTLAACGLYTATLISCKCVIYIRQRLTNEQLPSILLKPMNLPLELRLGSRCGPSTDLSLGWCSWHFPIVILLLFWNELNFWYFKLDSVYFIIQADRYYCRSSYSVVLYLN